MRARRLWSDDGAGCKSCRTIPRFHKYRGYCTRCYPIIYRISRIDRGLYRLRGRWARHNASTKGIRRNAENELEEIRELEAPVRTGSRNTLERSLEHSKGVRYFFDGCLDSEQRTRVYEVVARLAEAPAQPSICTIDLCSKTASIPRNRRMEHQVRGSTLITVHLRCRYSRRDTPIAATRSARCRFSKGNRGTRGD